MTNAHYDVNDVPRRRHAGKSSMESVDLQYEREQAKLQAKLKARSEALADYERRTLGGPHVSAVLPPVEKVRRPTTPTVHENKTFKVPEMFVEEEPGTPMAIRLARFNTGGTFNIFRPEEVHVPAHVTRAKPPFATDDETPRSARTSTTIPPYATDLEAKFDTYSEYRDTVKTTADMNDKLQGLTVNTGTPKKQPVRKPGFCWQWAFTDEQGNPLPDTEDPPYQEVDAPDFSLMSPRMDTYVTESVRIQ